MSETLTLREIEEQFKELQYYLSGGISSRIKLSILHNFLSVINQQTSPQRFYSYFQEIQEQIPELLLPHNLEFRSAEFLDQIKLYLEMMKKTGNEIETDPITSKFRETQDGTTGFADDTVWIPLVEQELTKRFGLIRVATIQPLTVQVEQRRSDADTDLIFFNNYPVNMGDPFYNQALDAVGAAKKQLKIRRNGGMPRFRVMFGFADREYFYTGESFGLGMSLAVLAQMEKVTIQRTQHKINQNAVITGGIDVNGQVRGVSEESLPAKLEAFYYSPFRTFVHPEINKSVAEETLAELALFSHSEPREESQSSRPNPNDPETQKLIIFPTSDLATVLKNGSTVQKKTITLRQWSRAHIRKNQVMRYVAAVLLIAGIGWGSWWFTRDLNPALALVEGKILFVKNAVGQLLWQHEFPFSFTADRYLHNQENGLLHTLDLDGDGSNEVVLGVNEEDGNYSGVVYCFEGDGTLRWTLIQNESIQCKQAQVDGHQKIRFIMPIKESQTLGAMSLIICVAHHLYFPYKIIKVNLEGEVVSEFRHCGQIQGLYYDKPTARRTGKVFFWGTNNQYNTAVLGRLDPAKMEGYAPGYDLKCDIPDAGTPAGLIYLKFPRPGKYKVSEGSMREEIPLFKPIGDDSFLAMMVSSHNASILYTFDADLNLLEFDLADAYLSAFREYRHTDLYDLYDFAEIAAHFCAFEYWDGKDWVVNSNIPQ